MKILRNANGINVGDKFRYRSNGVYIDGNWIDKGKEYNAEVVQVTKHLVILNIKLDIGTTPCMMASLGEPSAYNWAIRKVDIGRREKLMLLDD